MLSARLITSGCFSRVNRIMHKHFIGTGQLIRVMSSSAKIIGFAGATNSGKSSICCWLKSILPKDNITVKTLHMDHYYWSEDSPNHVFLPEFDYKFANWEDVRAVDWPSLEKDIVEWREQVGRVNEDNTNRKDMLLVEGIMIFNHRSLLPYFDKKYFFTLPKEECWERRRSRIYVPPDPEDYFEKIVWPSYVKLKNELTEVADIVYLDGTRDQLEMYEEVKSDIMSLYGSP